ncbi:hypothetical protein, partial [Enterobacter cloacae]|uniref:hypothetical protein n=1 Tax=Enterobacter cloacae TaxID=550 RepID=UPI0021BF219D
MAITRRWVHDEIHILIRTWMLPQGPGTRARIPWRWLQRAVTTKKKKQNEGKICEEPYSMR